MDTRRKCCGSPENQKKTRMISHPRRERLGGLLKYYYRDAA